MSKESYVRGFCKAAEAAGVDPVSLIKYAQNGGAWFRDGPTVQRSWYDEGVAASKNNPESVYRQIPGRIKLPTLGPVDNPLQKNLDQQALNNHINNNFLDRPSFWRGFAGVKMPETQDEKNKFTKSVNMWKSRGANSLDDARDSMFRISDVIKKTR